MYVSVCGLELLLYRGIGSVGHCILTKESHCMYIEAPIVNNTKSNWVAINMLTHLFFCLIVIKHQFVIMGGEGMVILIKELVADYIQWWKYYIRYTQTIP